MFFVDYTYFVNADTEEDILAQSVTIGQRFANGLSAYITHRRKDEDVTSSDPDATEDNIRATTYTIDYAKDNLTLLGEYIDNDSTQQSSEASRFEGRYNWAIGKSKRISVWASQQFQEYGVPQVRDVDSFSLGGEYYWEITERYHLTSDIDYITEKDSLFGTTDGFQLNSELVYAYRQLSFVTGIEYSTLSRDSNKNNTLFMYFRIARIF